MPDRVRRVGGTVERPAQRWTPAVHLLLRHLADAGVDVPRPLRLDGDQEVLSWLPGDSGSAAWAHAVPETGLVSMARLLARIHAASVGFVLPDDLSWADAAAPHRGPVICHGDFGPWNLTWIDGLAHGVFDWDLAYAGDPLDDVAYALEYVAPFRSDHEAMTWLAYPRPPDRRRRIRTFWRAYSGRDATSSDIAMLVDAVAARQIRVREIALALAAEGAEPQATWVRDGVDSEWVARIAWTHSNRLRILGAARAEEGTSD